MASDKTLVLITGANAGIGLALATALAASEAHHVLLGARDPARGAAAHASLPPAAQANASVLPLDVTSDASVTAAAATVRDRYGRLDALVNNAGVLPEFQSALADAGVPGRLEAALAVNVVGVARMTEAFGPLLRASKARWPRVVNVTSGAGSIAAKLVPGSRTHELFIPAYAPSKSALNMLSVQYAVQFQREAEADAGVRQIYVNAVCPGGVKTGLNGYRDGLGPVEDGCVEVLRLLREAEGETASFTNKEGVLPW